MSAIRINAPVLIPYTDNCKHENPLTREQIELFKLQFEQYGLIDEMHTIFDKAKTVGYVDYSYISKYPSSIEINQRDMHKKITYPKGTWFLDIIVTDETVINKIKSGEYTGLSATWTNQYTLDVMDEYPEFKKLKTEIIKNYEIQAKEVTLDDIENPICFCVSIVDKPCFENCLINKIYDLEKKQIVYNRRGDKMSKLKELLKSINKETEQSSIEELEERITDLETAIEKILEILQEEDKETEKTEEADDKKSEISKRLDDLEEAVAEILKAIKGKEKKAENKDKGSKQLKNHKATNRNTCKANSRLTFLEAFKKA